MNPLRLAFTTLIATLTVGGVTGSFVACSQDADSGTSGKRVALKTVARGEGAGPFVNALGWSVTLKTARVTVASLYYFDGEPIFSLRRALLPRAAFAHPGHYVAGEARGEMTTAGGVDLLATESALPNGIGISGAVRSARFTFGKAADGHAVYVEGEAKNGAVTVAFSGKADLGDVVDSAGEPKVEGCVFAPSDMQADGTVTVQIKPSVWFDQVDFTEVKADLSTSAVAFDGFTRGLKKGTAYVFSYRSP